MNRESKLFRKTMIDRDMQMTDLEKLLGRSRTTINRYFKEPIQVTPANMFLLFQALKFTPDEVKDFYFQLIDEYWRP